MSASISARHGGFTYIELVVVLTLISLLAAMFGPSIDRRIDDARIEAMIERMQSMATDAQVYSMGLETAAFDSDGIYVRTTQQIPAQSSSQIALFNDLAGTEYPSTNPYGEPYYLSEGAADRVFATTFIRKSEVGDRFAPPGAGVTDLGNRYELTVMAPDYGQRHYLRRSRTIKRFLEERNK